MKKVLSVLISLTMALSILSGLAVVYAGESEYTVLADFDFDTTENKAGFQAVMIDNSVGKPMTNFTYTEDAGYGLGTNYRNSANNNMLMFDEPVDRAAASSVNRYLEVEYDILSLATIDPNVSPTNGGAATVVLEQVNGVSAYNHYSGLEFNNTGNIYRFWSRAESFGKFNNEDWTRCKFVILLNDNGTVKKENSMTYYINGKMVGTGNDYHGTADNPLTVIDGIKLYSSYANFKIDNIKITKYTADKKPVEKGEIIAGLRRFARLYGDTSDNEDVTVLINSARDVYENDNATAEDANRALQAISEAESMVFTGVTEVVSYNFENEEQQNAFKESLKAKSNSGGSVSFVADTTGTFDIGKCVYNSVSHNNLALEEPIDRTAKSSINRYLEVEFDMLSLAIIDTENTGVNSTGAANIVLADRYTNESNNLVYSHFSGFEFNNDTTIYQFWARSNVLGKWKPDEWARCKMVMLLNDNGTVKKENTMKFYINGEMVGTGNDYNGTTDDPLTLISCLRLYSSTAPFRLDNLKISKYTAASIPVEKGGLVARIREFTKAYGEGITQNPEANALYESAKAVYYDGEATGADIMAALADLEEAERAAFPAEKIIENDFEETPAYFFDSITSGGTAKNYTESSAQPDEVTYADDPAFGIEKALKFAPAYSGAAASCAVKNFESISLNRPGEYLSFYFDVKKNFDNANGKMEISAVSGDNIAAGIFIEDGKLKYQNGEVIAEAASAPDFTKWNRVRFDVNLGENMYNVYIDGTLFVNGAALPAAVNNITGLRLGLQHDGGTVDFDNLMVITYTGEENNTPDKGALVRGMRDAHELLASGTLLSAEADVVNGTLNDVLKIYQSPIATASAVYAARDKIVFCVSNIKASVPGATPIVIPGPGVDIKDVVLQFNLHHGSFEGDASYKELFFDRQSNTDFSDVKFLDGNGSRLESEIFSTGNYDFISDSRLGYQNSNLHLSDNTLVTSKDGYVAFSHDNAQTWEKTPVAGELAFVDKNDNVYVTVRTGSDAGFYKASKDDNYQTSKLVIDSQDAIDLNVKEFFYRSVAQDDDGYIYVGRYQEEWIGVTLYVSDESGENFRCVDFRTDKQHVHTIKINKNVYPNEVYVTYDDSRNNPLCQVTTTRGGYDEIVDDPDFSTPCYPAGDSALAAKILANSQKHFTQVPVPYGANDFSGYFGVIDKDESKFYTAENGKRYTTPDNVYMLGMGESNILGGPSLFKTTDVMDSSKYYPVIETTQGSRNLMSPEEGVLVWGGLSGRYCMTPQLGISYDDGETWTTAYTEGYNYSGGAGNGPLRMMSDAFVPKGSTQKQVLMAGWGYSPSLRAKFGGDNYYGISYVTVDTLPANGMKIFVTLDKDQGYNPTSYEYSTDIAADGEIMIKGTKSWRGEGSALKFATPLEDETSIGMAYGFDVYTGNKTAVAASVFAADGDKTDTVLNLVFRTDNGKIYNADTDTVIAVDEAIKSAAFSVKILADYGARTCNIYINNCLAAEGVALNPSPGAPSELALSILDLSEDAELECLTSDDYDIPAEQSPIVAYFDKIGYADLFESNEEKFAVTAIVYRDSEGNITDSLEKGGSIESISIEKLDFEIDTAVLVAALYTGDSMVADCRIITVKGDGKYVLNMPVSADGLYEKIFMIKGIKNLEPLIFKNCLK